MTKAQAIIHAHRKHALQLRRNRKNKTLRIEKVQKLRRNKRNLPVLPVRPALPSPVWKADKRKGYVLVGLLIALVATFVAINLFSA